MKSRMTRNTNAAHKIDFTAYGLHKDRAPEWYLKFLNSALDFQLFLHRAFPQILRGLTSKHFHLMRQNRHLTSL